MSGRKFVGVVTLAMTLGVSACGPDDSVVWSDYAPQVRTNIDTAAAAKDCQTLQSLFDSANSNNASTRQRTGHGNAELMAYIDKSMHNAGCY
jgi:hypothetical protein